MLTGSCVTVTLVNPAGASDVAPNAMLVVPSVIELLVNDAFAMLLNVLLAPLIVLLVSVCVPVNVTTVESMLIVLDAEPLNVEPESNCNPVPTVNGFVVDAEIVPDPPKDTGTPL